MGEDRHSAVGNRQPGDHHTSGPWGIRPAFGSDDEFEVFPVDPPGIKAFGEPTEVAVVRNFGDDDPSEVAANANLIAAAPDMLAALRIAESFIAGFEDDELQEGINDRIAAIRSAIAKAKGQS